MKPIVWIWPAAILALAFVLSIDPHAPGNSLCYSVRVFGFACPACGMGRAFHELLHIRLGSALAFNPLVFPAALYVSALMFASATDYFQKTNYTDRLMRPKWSVPVAIIAIAVVVAVWVRNLYLY